MPPIDSDTLPAPPAAAHESARRAIVLRLLPLFSISGVAALIYQVCWQRMLTVVIGADTESVTIVVSAFMLGLGMGAILGGIAADRWRTHIPRLFAATEVLIGAFGLLSPMLIQALPALTQTASAPMIALLTFALLALPTTLMGATLPMLVTHCVAVYQAVGPAIGGLYFANTLGAAAGAAVTGMITFNYLGLHATIWVAAAMNAVVAVLSLLTLERTRV